MIKAVLFAMVLAVVGCEGAGMVNDDNGCSITLDASSWTEIQPGVFEHASEGPLIAPDVESGTPVIGNMCRVHSAAFKVDTSMLVEDVGTWMQDPPGNGPAYAVQTHAKVAVLPPK